jgi:DNA end-binding protein Ku
MPRSFWKGSLSFGLVEIPVRLYRATESDELGLAMLDRKDFAPVGYRRYNKETGEEVPWERIVRGYEYQPDEYVALTDEDLQRANVEATHTIDIVQFVQRDEIDAIYYDLPYYLEPQQTGSKSYALLRDALARMDRVGIAKIVLRVRQHIAALMVRDGALMLDLLRYPHEIRDVRELKLPARSAAGGSGRAGQEMKMAEQLIDGMTEPWKPDAFKDDYYDDLMALIEKRVRECKTHEIHKEAPGRERKARQVVDLMDLLKESLAKRGAARAPARAASAKPASRRKTGRRARSA